MKILIINVTQVVTILTPIVRELMKDDIYLAKQRVEPFVDSCLFNSFNEVFCISILHEYTNTAYNNIYTKVKNWLDGHVRSCVNPNEFNGFTNCELKAITNGEVLFLTDTGNYERNQF